MNTQAKISGETKKRNKAVRYALVAFIFLAVFLTIPYLYTSNPKSCTRCHAMEKYYSSWQKSSHAKAADNCFHCHVKQGSLNLWVYRISFYREVYASMVGANLKPAGATIPGIRSCLRRGCHSLNRVSSASGDIKINHRGHVIKVGLSCIRCHPGAAHPNVGKVGRLTPQRKLCMQCHAARKNDCSFCHVKKMQRGEGYKH
ncbi:MAG TPA: NapC/NirT family cytochrome c [Anaerolineae bacterium]|nr:NapC/NirT family cytochrome c [Anaerolineae bacterium]